MSEWSSQFLKIVCNSKKQTNMRSDSYHNMISSETDEGIWWPDQLRL